LTPSGYTGRLLKEDSSSRPKVAFGINIQGIHAKQKLFLIASVA
jgi:hypothetical protein